MICKRCGQNNAENLEFCQYCGEKLENNQPNIETLDINNEEEVLTTPVNNSVINNEETNGIGKVLVNPVAEDNGDESPNANLNILKLLLLTIGVLIRPGTTIVDKTKKYNKTKTGLFVYFVFATLTFLVYLGSSIVKNCFIQTYNIATEKYTTSLDFGQMQYLNYTNLILEALLVGYVILLILVLLYYIASFLTNKGLSLGRYFVIITLSLSPFLLVSCAASSLISIFNTTFGSWLFIFGIAYSLIILLCTINDVIVFKNTNQKIIYHSLILFSCFLICYVLISVFAKDLIPF